MAKNSLKAKIESAEAALAGSLTTPMRQKEEEAQEYLSSATIQDAYALFMRMCPMSKIAEITNISVQTIKRYVNGFDGKPGWKAERDALGKEIGELVKQSMLANLHKNSSLAMSLIERGLKAVQIKHENEQTEPTLDEVFKIAKVFDMLYKNKIAEQKSDPDQSSAALTPNEVVEAFQSDPYYRFAFKGPANDSGDTSSSE